MHVKSKKMDKHLHCTLKQKFTFNTDQNSPSSSICKPMSCFTLSGTEYHSADLQHHRKYMCSFCMLKKWEFHSFINSLIHSLIHSFIHSFIHLHSFTHSLTHSINHTFIQSIIRSLIRSITHSITQSLIHSLTHSYIHSFIYSHTCSFIHPSIHPSIHSLIYSLACWFTQSFIQTLFVIWHVLLYESTQNASSSNVCQVYLS